MRCEILNFIFFKLVLLKIRRNFRLPAKKINYIHGYKLMCFNIRTILLRWKYPLQKKKKQFEFNCRSKKTNCKPTKQTSFAKIRSNPTHLSFFPITLITILYHTYPAIIIVVVTPARSRTSNHRTSIYSQLITRRYLTPRRRYRHSTHTHTHTRNFARTRIIYI